MHIGLYAGSFDPVTLGHEDIVRRALRLVDKLVVAVALNSGKAPMFTADERAEFLRLTIRDDRVEVRQFDGLLVDLAREIGANVLVRGVRNVTDYDYEVQMGRMNRQLAPEIETVFLAPSADVAHISSTFARDIARHRGDLTGVVEPAVADVLRARFAS